MISDLPRDVAEEVLSRLPVTCLGGVRSACKKWNTLTKDEDFIKKHLGKNQRRKVVMLLDYKVYLMSVDLLTPPSIERIGKLVSLYHKDPAATADGVEISNIFHCDGLLLCTTRGSQLVVWNPYSGQTRWIEPRDSYDILDGYALGYEKNNCSLPRSYKVLRFVDFYDLSLKRHVREFELYSFNSNSWKVVDVNPDWSVVFYHRGVSLKGNTYWFAEENLVGVAPGTDISDLRDFLVCFDFTEERFGPSLPLPFHSFGVIVNLSSVREEQLAVLTGEQGFPPYTFNIWISSKIEPHAVSWNKLFLNVDMQPITGSLYLDTGGSFFVDEEEEEVVVVVDVANRDTILPTRNIAFIIGKNGHFKRVDLGGRADPTNRYADPTNRYPHPLVCSYVPSSVDIM